MPRLVRVPVLVLVLSTATLLAGVASAAAVTRYASPTGLDTTSDCTSPDPGPNGPCTLRRAVEFVSGLSDEVIVAPGDYDLGTDSLNILGINVHGADGQPRPRILSNAPNFGVGTGSNATLRRVAIDYDGPFQALGHGSGLVEQVVVHGSGQFACEVEDDATLRDSVCWDDAGGGFGARVESIAGIHSANLRNVTSVATGVGSVGLQVRSINTGVQQNLVAKNVIAEGVSADVAAEAGNAGSVATASLSNSNFSTELENANSGTASTTNPGTGTGNQTAAPIFTDAGIGLFHQAPGSPTIDAGGVADLLGSADIDADPRTLGATPDIGADEFVPSQPEPPPDNTPPPVSKPSNAFTIGAITRNKKRGTATIPITVPNEGGLAASGKGLRATLSGPPNRLLIRATGKKKRKLNETGKVKLNVAITYTPTGGDPNTQSVNVRLIKR